MHRTIVLLFLQRLRLLAVALGLTAICLPAGATTKGLNQIVTPDIQPTGVLSISYQLQNSALGNSQQTQYELGLTKRVEVAVFSGYDPGETIYNAEVGLVQQKSFLLSTGLLGVKTRLKSQPFLEGGYYKGKAEYIAGVQQQDANLEGVFGYGYQATPKVQLMFDYITGVQNFATAGATFTLSRTLSFNSAIYVSNQSPHNLYPYGVLTWNITLWKPKK